MKSMHGIKFGRKKKSIYKLLNDWQKQVDSIHIDSDLRRKLREVTIDAFEILEKDASYRISLLGEFSSGKSTLVMALTGAEVATGAGVTTSETRSFEWNGMTLVDTPGIQAESDSTGHDDISRTSTLDADLILFVLTNELFSDRLATYFRFVAGTDGGGLGLADKMLAIVNKMDREDNEDEVIVSEVESAIAPHRVPVCPAAVENYLKSRKYGGDRKERLVNRSRVPELLAAIDRFVEERGELGRLTRPLQRFEAALEEQRDSLLGDNEHVRQEIENNRRRRSKVSEANGRLSSLEREWVRELRRIALSRTTETLNSVADVKTTEELQERFDTTDQAIERELETYQVDISNALDCWAREFREDVEDIDTGKIKQDIRIFGAEKSEFVELEKSRTQDIEFAKLGRKILEDGLAPMAGKLSENPEAVVKLVGKMKKFRPWGKTKLSRKVAKTAKFAEKALPILVTALDFYAEYRKEKDLDGKERQLAKLRCTLRREFEQRADWYAEELRKRLDGVRKETTHKLLDLLEEHAAKVVADEAREKGAADLASEFIGRSRSLRHEIAAAGS